MVLKVITGADLKQRITNSLPKVVKGDYRGCIGHGFSAIGVYRIFMGTQEGISQAREAWLYSGEIELSRLRQDLYGD